MGTVSDHSGRAGHKLHDGTQIVISKKKKISASFLYLHICFKTSELRN